MKKPLETDLYAPVKAWLEGQGHRVKGEVGGADVVARRPGALVIVELKLGFSLILLQQAVVRQAQCDEVYVAVPRWRGKAGWRAFKGNVGLCRRLGLGVLSVALADGAVQCHAAPGPFQPRRSPKRRARLEKEFDSRAGDPTQGGTNGQVMTSYRQDAIACAIYLSGTGAAKGAQVARGAGVARATAIMAANHYGWFDRVARGIYALSEAGMAAVADAPLPSCG
ncbi:hypothetical protein DC366_12435 [Pelagivirga sediminicola]|uniref:Uncharacterized protein n=1 Tax=Pelagivirga sediminicola TaxID=2170575 RepID=A0A2T7G642_9RHOB|nr:DUF2161 family putative PD-(D/E)XK-type phosphodiesterase [Pelagivirga sediminicola]PVA09909.1 hypothetical protein DC366_12435 [Pelagivirga sediminicola]